MSSSRKRFTWAIALGVAATGLAAPAASANPAGTGLVISEVYGGGGNSGATLKNDFIELYNPTDTAIPVEGWSVQWRSGTGTAAATGVTSLTGSVPAKSHYLVGQGAGSGGTVDLPKPDVSGAISMGGSNGTAMLVTDSTAVNPGTGVFDATQFSTVVDLVGVDSNVYEAAKAPGMSSSTSVSRGASGTDTDNNSTDFTAGAPTPTASGGTTDPDPEPTPDPEPKTIPEIQGAGMTSPLVGTLVTTTGVVTAAYADGGLNGFYIQTPGSGSADLNLAYRAASDGVFVYQELPARPVTVSPGDHVEVTGTVAEYAGMTQVSVTASTDIVELTETAIAPVASSTTRWPRTKAAKERLEGMLYVPSGDFTVTNTYNTNQFGEVGLAQGDKPLIQPTQVEDAQTGDIAAIEADNAARAIQLDDGSSVNFSSSSNSGLTPAYISNAEPVRVGAGVTFTEPVIFTEGGSSSAPTYRFQPLAPVVGPDNTASPADFENTRTAAPDAERIDPAGKADVKVASFNVLNYFTTLGDADDDNVGDGGCIAYKDRDGDGTNVSGGCDQRGAWDPQDLERQQIKIVKAINALDADVVGLMEIENSAKLGEAADEATQSLVAALNAEAGSGVWAANPSSSDLPPVAEMDVISNAIIYRTAAVERVGEARALGELSGSGEAFDNAREPIAQAFASVQGGTPFLVVVNHFKSKGSGFDDKTGQGNANPDRISQAEALRDWIPAVQSDLGVEAVLLAGDFNAYAMEDPMQVLYAAGYENVEQEFGGDEYSYSYQALSGSLDHIVANAAAMDLATGADIWNINSGEALPLEYSRFNYHGTDFHEPTPYRSSDHDPVVLGLDLAAEPEVVKAESRTSVKVLPRKVRQNRTRAVLAIRVRAAGLVPTGEVKVWVSGQGRRFVTLRDGKATIRLAKFVRPGRKKVQVTYLGSDLVEASTARAFFRVVRKR